MFQFKYYEASKEEEWDRFIAQNAVNGTFLQSRHFLNYHKPGKFQDVSLMVYDEKNRLAALIPACEIVQEEKKIFYSHKGTTFGGIIISQKYYKAEAVMILVRQLLDFLKTLAYDEVYLKQTPDLFSKRENALWQYVYAYYGFLEYKELSTYVDLSAKAEDIAAGLSNGKRRNVREGIKKGLDFRPLDQKEHIADFYSVLCENLKKYGAVPVHTLEELLEFKDLRLPDRCGFFGVFKDGVLLAGCMVFYFQENTCVHTQYLAARQEYQKLSPMSYLYYALMMEMKKRGYQKISWGISTEDYGTRLNMGLIRNKESFGSSYCNNLTYYYDLAQWLSSGYVRGGDA